MAHPEDIVALATHDLADEATAQPCRPHDALDRNTFAGHAPDGFVCMFSALETVVLQALGPGEQGGIELRRPNSAADRRHGPSHRRQKRHADGLEEVPAIRHLNRLRQGARDGTAIAIAGDDLDLGLAPQPCLDGRRLPARRRAGSMIRRRSRSQIKVP
ncbi:hypothetical protein [Sagittula stellata]|uniref:hypothetical protein n=1 Tax=Sagittula stellata TaxID=52603 RepID=UPI00058D20BA|nr:hypothetical protein [Sagittula stellata]